jgi:hypothetical protein
VKDGVSEEPPLEFEEGERTCFSILVDSLWAQGDNEENCCARQGHEHDGFLMQYPCKTDACVYKTCFH